MNVIYVFIQSKTPFSFQCLKIRTLDNVDTIKEKIRGIQDAFMICYNPLQPLNARHLVSTVCTQTTGDTIIQSQIIKIELIVESMDTLAHIRNLLSTRFPVEDINDAEAFPTEGTLSFESVNIPRVKILRDTDIFKFFTPEDIGFQLIDGETPLFPQYRLTSDQIKQSLLGECAFAAIITGFCTDRPYIIYNCMRDNNDGFILFRFYSQDAEPQPCFYLLQKSMLIRQSSGAQLTQHFLWAHMLLKGYAVHMALQTQSTSTSTTSSSMHPQPQFSFQSFLEGINYIDLSHALTGEGQFDFFNSGTKQTQNLRNSVQKKDQTPPTNDDYLTLFQTLKQRACPVYLSATRDHFGGSSEKIIHGKKIYAKHAYYVLKVHDGLITVLNPWQAISVEQLHPSVHDHVAASITWEALKKQSQGHSGSVPPQSTTPLSTQHQPQDEVLYDADTENYSGAITLDIAELLEGFDGIRACKEETLWKSLKSEIVKILQAYMQFAGYHKGLAAILQRIFLIDLPETFYIESLVKITHELHHVCSSLPIYPWIKGNPIFDLVVVLNSLLPSDKKLLPTATQVCQQPQNFSQLYKAEFIYVHAKMNELYEPYRTLFKKICPESSKKHTQLLSILQEFSPKLYIVSSHLNIRMYGETLLTYTATQAFNYKTSLICLLIENILSRNIPVHTKNIRNQSPLMIIFTKAADIVTIPLNSQQLLIPFSIAIKIIDKLCKNATLEDLNELKIVKEYLDKLPHSKKDALTQAYNFALTECHKQFQHHFDVSRMQILAAEQSKRLEIFQRKAIDDKALAATLRHTFPSAAFAMRLTQKELKHCQNVIFNNIRCMHFDDTNIFLRNFNLLQRSPYLTKSNINHMLAEMSSFITSIRDTPNEKKNIELAWIQIRMCIHQLCNDTFG